MVGSRVLFAVLLALVLPYAGAADVITEWNTIAVDTIKTEGIYAPPASRALAMMHAAMYDAANSVKRKSTPYRVDVSVTKPISAELTAAVAAHSILAALYPKHAGHYDQALAGWIKREPQDVVKKNSIELGDRIAKDMLEWRKNDRSADVVVYTPRHTPGDWEPTPPKFAKASVPHWPNVTPFAIKSGAQFRPKGPPKLDSKEFAEALQEVKTVGAKDSPSRTKDHTEIPHFWANAGGTDSLPGHWNLIAQQLAAERKNDLHQNARLFALLNIALADAIITSYDSKYHYRFWRPITAIRQTDPNWTPLLDNPEYPEYTAAHSTASGAAARILALLFGSDRVSFMLPSATPLAGPRHYTSIWQSAEEAGQSRIYAGIHFRFSNRDGLESGKKVADYVFNNYMRPL